MKTRLWWIQIAFASLGTILFGLWLNGYHPELDWFAKFFIVMVCYWFLLTLAELITWGK
jgi:hypothetical protein